MSGHTPAPVQGPPDLGYSGTMGTCIELPAGYSPGDLVTLKPRAGERGYHDPVENGCIKLWSDSINRHVGVPVGSQALIVSLLALTSNLPGTGLHDMVFDILVESVDLGPVVVSTFADRLIPVEALS